MDRDSRRGGRGGGIEEPAARGGLGRGEAGEALDLDGGRFEDGVAGAVVTDEELDGAVLDGVAEVGGAAGLGAARVVGDGVVGDGQDEEQGEVVDLEHGAGGVVAEADVEAGDGDLRMVLVAEGRVVGVVDEVGHALEDGAVPVAVGGAVVDRGDEGADHRREIGVVHAEEAGGALVDLDAVLHRCLLGEHGREAAFNYQGVEAFTSCGRQSDPPTGAGGGPALQTGRAPHARRRVPEPPSGGTCRARKRRGR